MTKKEVKKERIRAEDNTQSIGSNVIASKKKSLVKIEDKIKSKIEASKTSLRLLIRIAIRKTIMPRIILNLLK